jgi:hypothetical protein
MKLDLVVPLLNLRSQERFHRITPGDGEVLGVLLHEFFLEFCVG